METTRMMSAIAYIGMMAFVVGIFGCVASIHGSFEMGMMFCKIGSVGAMTAFISKIYNKI